MFKGMMIDDESLQPAQRLVGQFPGRHFLLQLAALRHCPVLDHHLQSLLLHFFLDPVLVPVSALQDGAVGHDAAVPGVDHLALLLLLLPLFGDGGVLAVLLAAGAGVV